MLMNFYISYIFIGIVFFIASIILLKKGIKLKSKNIIAGTIIPPIEPITGKDAFFIEDKFPYKIFSLISSHTFQKKKNIKRRKSLLKMWKPYQR